VKQLQNELDTIDNWRLMKNHGRSDTRLHFLFLSCHQSLEQFTADRSEVDAPPVNAFKRHLEKRRIREMDFFKDH